MVRGLWDGVQPMIKQATYSNGSREVVISASEADVWLEATDSVINFPGLVELDGDNLFMSYHRGRHGGVEPLAGVVSSDLGATWQPAPDDSPFIDRHPDTGLNTMDFGSGIIGYPSDGTITRIDTYPLENYQEPYLSAEGPHHLVQQRADSTFQLRRWSKSGELLEVHPFKVEGIPWEMASYENYSRLIELDNGDYMTVTEQQVGPPEVLDGLSPSGRQMVQYSFSSSVIRSSDRGHTWEVRRALPSRRPQAGLRHCGSSGGRGIRRAGHHPACERRRPLHDADGQLLADVPVALDGWRRDLVRAGIGWLAGRETAPAEAGRTACWLAWQGAVGMGIRRLRT